MEKVKVKDSGLKVGDVLIRVSHWGFTSTTWYKIKRVTECKVVLDELPTSYETSYGPNTTGSFCMPVVDGEVSESCPFVFSTTTEKDISSFVYKDYDGEIRVRLPKSYGSSLRQWDGEPGWVNCY